MDAMDPPVPMIITVTTLERRTIPLDVVHTHTTEAVKAMIEEKEGIPADRQRLLFNQELLEDGRTLQRSGVEDAATLSLVLRLTENHVELEPAPAAALGGRVTGWQWVPRGDLARTSTQAVYECRVTGTRETGTFTYTTRYSLKCNWNGLVGECEKRYSGAPLSLVSADACCR